MASLYEISQEIMNCVDPDTGEIIDPEKLSGLLMARDAKIEGVALWVKNLESDALAYKAEKEAFAEREKAAKLKAASLRLWLTEALGGEKFQSAKCAVSFRKSVSVAVDDPTTLPAEFVTVKTTTEPNKAAIKDALKGGAVIPGCELVAKLNAQIK